MAKVYYFVTNQDLKDSYNKNNDTCYLLPILNQQADVNHLIITDPSISTEHSFALSSFPKEAVFFFSIEIKDIDGNFYRQQFESGSQNCSYLNNLNWSWGQQIIQ